LEKTAAKTTVMLQQAFKALVNHRSTSGFPVSKMATCQLKTCHDLAVLRRAAMRKTSKKFDRPLMKIIERPLSKFLNKQKCHGVPASEF
jgi:hypothetical protein